MSNEFCFDGPLLTSMNPFGLLKDAKEPTLSQFLIEFYTKHNPEKLNDVDRLIQYYSGQELALFEELDFRYGTNFCKDPPIKIRQTMNSTIPLNTQTPASSPLKPAVNKIVLLGNSGVGKTNLLSRLNSGEFSEEFCSTIGVEFLTWTIDINGASIKAQIWDTAGQERFNAMMTTYYRKAVGAVFVYDVSDPSSLEAIRIWHEQLMNVAEQGLHTILVGNKSDLTGENCKVSPSHAQSFATSMNMMYVETSAKTGENVERVFRYLLTEIHRSQVHHPKMATIDLTTENYYTNDECCL